jgi:hypothetical protein
VIIGRPVEEVFAFMADLENWARLQPSLRVNEQASGSPMEVGDTFRQAIEIPGKRIELVGEVVEYEKDEMLSFEYAWNQLSLGISLIFEPLNGSTRLTARGQGRMGGLFALFETLVNGEINAQLKTNLDDLKNLLEAQPTNT